MCVCVWLSHVCLTFLLPAAVCFLELGVESCVDFLLVYNRGLEEDFDGGVGVFRTLWERERRALWERKRGKTLWERHSVRMRGKNIVGEWKKDTMGEENKNTVGEMNTVGEEQHCGRGGKRTRTPVWEWGFKSSEMFKKAHKKA